MPTFDDEGLVGLQDGQGFGGAEIGEGVDVARPDGVELCRRVADEAEHHLVQFRHGRIAEVGVAHQHDAVARYPAVELERAGADRALLVGLRRFRRHDGGVVGAHVEQELAVGPRQGDRHRQRIGRLDRLDRREIALLGIDRAVAARPVQGELDVGGIRTPCRHGT